MLTRKTTEQIEKERLDKIKNESVTTENVNIEKLDSELLKETEETKAQTSDSSSIHTSSEPIEADVIKQEEVKEDIKTPDTSEEPSDSNEPLTDDLKELVEAINTAKSQYNKATTISRWVGMGVILIVVALILVFTLVLRTYIGDIWTIVLVVILLIGLFCYNIFGKKALERKAGSYIGEYYNVLIKHILNFDGISEVKNDPKAKLDKQVFIDTRTYLNIYDLSSRNITHFKFNDQEFMMAEIAPQVRGNKMLEACFVGKLIQSKNDFDFPGRILVSIKGNGNIWKPLNDIAGLTVVGENSRFVVYSNYEKYRTILTGDIIREIEKLRIDNDLFDAFISIKAGMTSIGLDLSNDIMDIPTNKDYKVQKNEKLKENVQLSIQIISDINNN